MDRARNDDHGQEPARLAPRDDAFTVGPFLVTPQRNRLGRGPHAITLQPKVMRLLCTLASEPGRTFSRADLIEAVWEGTIVSDAAIDRAMCNLRKALGDRAARPDFVETIHKRGFRLKVPVTPANPRPPRPYSRVRPSARLRDLRAKVGRGRLIAAALGVGMLVAAPATVPPKDGQVNSKPPVAWEADTVPSVARMPIASVPTDDERCREWGLTPV